MRGNHAYAIMLAHGDSEQMPREEEGQGRSIIVVGNVARRRPRGNALVFGQSDCYGDGIATLRSQ